MICLTFDTDHMTEDRLAEFLEEVCFPGAGTFFCTQPYACLDKSVHELAPHPMLVEGSDWGIELAEKRAQFPDALGWRSHSCVYSHKLAEWLSLNGYQYASTNEHFGQTGMRPFRQPWGVWQIPIYYMDNMDFGRLRFWGADKTLPFDTTLIDRAMNEDGLYVFDFHPIHLMLNTPNLDFYLQMRDRFRGGIDVGELVYPEVGTRNFFQALCDAMIKSGKASHRLHDALTTWEKSAGQKISKGHQG